MTLVIWFYKYNYTISTIINSNTFVREFIEILFSASGCDIVIPVASFISSRGLIKNRKDVR